MTFHAPYILRHESQRGHRSRTITGEPLPRPSTAPWCRSPLSTSRSSWQMTIRPTARAASLRQLERQHPGHASRHLPRQNLVRTGNLLDALGRLPGRVRGVARRRRPLDRPHKLQRQADFLDAHAALFARAATPSTTFMKTAAGRRSAFPTADQAALDPGRHPLGPGQFSHLLVHVPPAAAVVAARLAADACGSATGRS